MKNKKMKNKKMKNNKKFTTRRKFQKNAHTQVETL